MRWVLKLLALLAALAAINYPALVNGYPLLYSDSGTYIVAGFLNYIPVDRPYFYSWFVRHTSMGFSIWFTLIAQSLLLFYASRMALKYVLCLKEPFYSACLLMVGISFTTGLAYNNSQIIADAFSPIALLCFSTLLAARYIPKGHRFFLVLIFLFAVSTHSSHLLIFSLLAIGLLLTRLVFKQKPFFKERKQAHKRLIFLGVSTWLLVSIFNFWLGAGFKPSKAGNIFLAARTIETGAAKIYLDKHCPNAPNELCAVKDNLPPHAVAFLWEFETSPFYDECTENGGWGNCWTSKNEEYGDLVKGIIGYTPSRNNLIEHCLDDSWTQLGKFDLGYIVPMAQGSPVYGPIKDFLSADWAMYQNAIQYNKPLTYETESAIQRWLVYLSLAVIVVFLFVGAKTKHFNATLAFAVIVLVGTVVNGIVCASFSGVVDRYMARMIWLVPLAAVFLIWQWFLLRKQTTK